MDCVKGVNHVENNRLRLVQLRGSSFWLLYFSGIRSKIGRKNFCTIVYFCFQVCCSLQP